MIGAEFAIAGLLGTQLLESKYLIKEDFLLVQKVIRSTLPYLYWSKRGYAQYWYYFEQAAKKFPQKKAISYTKQIKPTNEARLDDAGYPIYDELFSIEEYTYSELYDMILRMSWILVNEHGITSKDTIGINSTNKPLFLVLWFALWNIGALPSFINYNTMEKPLIHCIKIADISQIFIDPDCAINIQESEPKINEELPHVKLNYINESELFARLKSKTTPKHRAADKTRRPENTDCSPGVLIYTSGTTGLPKAGIMSWRKAFMAAMFFGYIMKIDSQSNVLTAMPLYHATAAMLAICPTLLVGGCVTLSAKFSSSTFWTQAKLSKSTHIQYVGETCRYLINSKYHPDETKHQVRIAYGNGLRRDIWKSFKERFRIEAVGEFYAATESPIATTNLQFGDFGIGACRKFGSFLNLLLSFQQRIVMMDPEDENEIWRDPKTGFCKVAAIDKPGEFIMKILNPQKVEETFQGYYGNKEATNSKILLNVFRKGDAWFRSGDLLKMDKHGLLYFVDRLGDTFRWKSENVSATEVENELMGSGVIKQSVVVGVQVPKHEGRACFAVLEPLDDLSDQQVLKKVHEHVMHSLPNYAQPQFIKITPEIESSHNNKVPKNQFKKQKLPKGDDGSELIYWLNGEKYEELTEEAWYNICHGKAKL
ncbi:FAT1 [[Candida] subhashii]|uniref:Very long-chain fatty acid transport protein n=1 Tax=[Candida] subhashii TaxID=561895 RepID=A0A8J5QSJ3_9ASCO|nr:FAT1 [[Candida] subhashii]KAG7665633.1 FAT1 [[Candida] subhashii]